MKYFIQFEGKEKALVKCIIIAQVIIIILLIKIAFRPIELYIDNIQLREICSWQKQDSKEEENVAKAEELLD